MLAEHQAEAVVRVLELLGRCGGALLADEPGLGKSYVAAEVARREESRGVSVEVIAPCSLVPQWNETLRRFGVVADILTPDSMAGQAAMPEPRRRLLIVDEAHAFRNPGTQRYDALARRSVGASLLLITATPLCNSPRDLRALIDLLVADDALAGRGVPSIDAAFDLRQNGTIAAVVGELVIRRDRHVLPPALQFGALAARVISYDLFDGQGTITALLESLRFPSIGRTGLLGQFLWRRLESSEAALLESIRRQRRFYERALECLRAGRSLPKAEYRRAFAHEEDADAVQQVLFWELFTHGSQTASAQEIEAETDRLDRLRECLVLSPRAKFQALLRELGSDPAVIFTGWAATAEAIAATLPGPAAVATGRDRRTAVTAINQFLAGRVDRLVATDLAAEGLNLQRAGLVVHFDLPWNPVKIDQRNGRALRIGQRRESVEALYFLPRRDRSRALSVVAGKNEMRRRMLPVERARSVPPPSPEAVTTLRPRVSAGAAVVRFGAQFLPERAHKRHKAGVERLLAAMPGAGLDDQALQRVKDLLELEPGAWPGRSEPPTL